MKAFTPKDLYSHADIKTGDLRKESAVTAVIVFINHLCHVHVQTAHPSHIIESAVRSRHDAGLTS